MRPKRTGGWPHRLSPEKSSSTYSSGFPPLPPNHNTHRSPGPRPSPLVLHLTITMLSKSVLRSVARSVPSSRSVLSSLPRFTPSTPLTTSSASSSLRRSFATAPPPTGDAAAEGAAPAAEGAEEASPETIVEDPKLKELATKVEEQSKKVAELTVSTETLPSRFSWTLEACVHVRSSDTGGSGPISTEGHLFFWVERNRTPSRACECPNDGHRGREEAVRNAGWLALTAHQLGCRSTGPTRGC